MCCDTTVGTRIRRVCITGMSMTLRPVKTTLSREEFPVLSEMVDELAAMFPDAR